MQALWNRLDRIYEYLEDPANARDWEVVIGGTVGTLGGVAMANSTRGAVSPEFVVGAVDVALSAVILGVARWIHVDMQQTAEARASLEHTTDPAGA